MGLLDRIAMPLFWCTAFGSMCGGVALIPLIRERRKREETAEERVQRLLHGKI